MLKKKSDYIKIFLIIVIVGLTAYLTISNWDYLKNIKTEDIVAFIRRRPKLIFWELMLLYGIRVFIVFIPPSTFTLLAGAFFNIGTSIIINLIGTFVNLTTTFFISRFLGKDFVDRLLNKKNLKEKLEIKDKGKKGIFLLRFLPVTPVDAVSLVLGVCEINYLDYIKASFLGMAPRVILMSYIGNGIKNPFSLKFIIPVVCMIILSAVGFFVYNSSEKKKKKSK